MNTALGIFVRNLLQGKVKTRLAAKVGDAKAFEIYKLMLEHTRHISRAVKASRYVFYSDGIEERDGWSNDAFIKKGQTAGDLGNKMAAAFHELFREGHDSVLIIGSDCMELTSAIVDDAFQILKHTDVVVGPATDGGYYLLGLKAIHRPLFADMPWSTGNLLSQTLNACRKEKLSYALLPELSDIDEEEDWLRFQRHYNEEPAAG